MDPSIRDSSNNLSKLQVSLLGQTEGEVIGVEVQFSELRQKLKDTIDSEHMFNEERTRDEEELVDQGIVMKGFLVEKESGESFDTTMRQGIEGSQIYVGIFGIPGIPNLL
jgi:hypothetical protein